LKIHGGNYEECHLLGCDFVWVLKEPTFRKNIASIIMVKKSRELGTTLAVAFLKEPRGATSQEIAYLFI
jgi:hypothetical protein